MKLIGKLAALIALAAMASPQALAQGRKELRINEVMIQNETSVVDDYGQHSAWFELINPTHAPVEISSIYITDDINNPRKYYVPRGDARTKVGKGQTVLFHADGNPNHGTFYINFPLTPGEDNFLAVFDADGVSLIDSVIIPANLPANCSYARTPDANGKWAVHDDSAEAPVTPGGLNVVKGPNNKIENFKTMDENGFAMSTMAMSIVFGALLVLSLCFIIFSSINKRKAAVAIPEDALTPAPQPAADADAEVAAAIAMALHQHLNAGVGNARLTINHNTASAWANKIYAMRQLPR